MDAHKSINAITAIFGGIVVIAIVAVIVGSQQTAGVIGSVFGGFGSVIKAAVAPVAGGSGAGTIQAAAAQPLGALSSGSPTSYATGLSSPSGNFSPATFQLGGNGGYLGQLGGVPAYGGGGPGGLDWSSIGSGAPADSYGTDFSSF